MAEIESGALIIILSKLRQINRIYPERLLSVKYYYEKAALYANIKILTLPSLSISPNK